MAFSLERRRAQLEAAIASLYGDQKSHEVNHNNQENNKLKNSGNIKPLENTKIIAKDISSEYF